MSRKLPIKRLPGSSVKVLHVCSELDSIKAIEANVAKLNLIIVGNGHPEDSVVFKLARVIDSNIEISKGIQAMTESISDLSIKQKQNAEENRDLANKAQKSIDSTISEMIGFKDGVNTVKKEERYSLVKRYYITVIIVSIFTIVSILFQIFNHKDTKEGLQQVSKEVGPHLNARGMYYWGTDSTNLLYFENKK